MRRPMSVNQYLGELLLGTDPAMRLRVAQTGLALLLMLTGMAVVLWAAWALHLPREPLYLWTLSSLFAIVIVYMTIRCGWSEHFKDPSLTLPQMAIAIICSASGYALMGPVRAIACNSSITPGIRACAWVGAGRLRSLAEHAPEVSVEGIDPDGFDGQQGLVVDIELAAAGGLSKAEPVGRLVSRAAKA
jgi:hypothetical protein